MLSRKSKYGLKALMALADSDGRRPVQASDLAAGQRLPKKFLEAILLELTRHGLVHSKKGRGGGYALSREPGDIAVGQVIRILNGPLALVPCVSQTAYTPCEECIDEQTCAVHLAMKEVRDATAAILDNTTLESLGAKVRKSRARQQRARRAGKTLARA